MPRLTVVTPTYFPEPIGTPHYARDLVRWFANVGWDVRVVTGQPYYPEFARHPGYGRGRRRDHVDGIPVLRVPTFIPPRGSAAGRFANELNFATQAVARACGRRTEAVLSISPGTPWVVPAASAFRLPGGRHVALVHDIQSGLASALDLAPGAFHAALRANERWSLDHADEIAVLTAPMGGALRQLGATKPIGVVPLWATVSRPDPAPPPRRSVQYSGNFGAKQGVDLLVPLAAALRRRDPTVELVLRGSGPRFDALAQEVRDAGLTNVVLAEPVPFEELAVALAASPVHLCLQAPGSADYAMPSKVVNALSVGASVVALAEAGSPLAELADDVDGLHQVEPVDLAVAADLVVRLVEQGAVESRLREIAASASARFSRDAVLSDLAARLRPGPGPQ